jgi:biopolymer transport protein ExbD
MSGHAGTAHGAFDDPLSQGLVSRRHKKDDAEFDITAMIDLVFMMNIYFLVTFLGVASGDLALPSANHGRPLDAAKAIPISIVAGKDFGSVDVYLGDGKKGTAITDSVEQEERIAAAVEAGTAAGKSAVILKAEKNVRLREIKRISIAAAHEGVTLHMAVMEKDTKE